MMRVSQQFTRTLRESPRASEGGSQDVLVRAGFMRQLTSGVYSLLPLGLRVSQKIAQIVREEIDEIGGQEVSLPTIQPLELWEQEASTGISRARVMGDMLFTLRDRRGREMALAPAHEEVVNGLVAEFVRSYRDLPQLLYQLGTTFCDQPRPRGGLLCAREALTQDLYSVDGDAAGMHTSYSKITDAYRLIFERIGLRCLIVAADNGVYAAQDAHQYIALTAAGEDEVVICAHCGYSAHREKAEFARDELPREVEGTLEEVYTPGCASISDLAAFLGVPETRTMKVVCYAVSGRIIMTLVRGDLEVNDVKLRNALARAGLNVAALRLATSEELTQAGIVAGFTSPLDKDEHILLLADHSLRQGNNFVAGANKVDYHLINVNYPRDFRVDHWADIASACAGARCQRCSSTLHVERGVEIGRLATPGTYYSDLFGTTFLDGAGEAQPFFMGYYRFEIGRALAALVEQNHDEKGLIWPFSVAPYHVHLLGLDLDKGENREIAEQLYASLKAVGIDVLYDDRSESAGVKFNDADLLGLPLRAVISKRSLKNGGVELKLRASSDSRIVPIAEAVGIIRDEVGKGIAERR